VVAVLDQGAGGLDAPGAEVDGHHGVGVGFLGPGHEFVEAEEVGFHRLPGQIEAPGPLAHRADRVFPVERRNKVAPGVAHHRHVEFPDQGQDVLPEPRGIGLRMAWLVDTAVNGPAQVLNEGPKNPLIDLADSEFLIEVQRSFHEFSFQARDAVPKNGDHRASRKIDRPGEIVNKQLI